jgi:predicted ester cyclase
MINRADDNETVDPAKAHADIQFFVDEVMNGKDVSRLAEICTADYEMDPRCQMPGQEPGLKGMQWHMGLFLKAFPDLKWTLEDMIVQGNRGVSVHSFVATHQGEFMGIAPTQREVRGFGICCEVFNADGKLQFSGYVMDSIGLMQQLCPDAFAFDSKRR